ncbi:MAG: PaaI family thioesterase [Actinobacteria bacterium]|nr:PaaI family thioesterase [Actinomycetota bacterium]
MAAQRLPTQPPDDAVVPQRHPDAPEPGTEIASHYPRCFSCGTEHPTGLHMQIFAQEGLGVSAEFEVTEHHQGAPGLAHGGLLAAAFDEALGSLSWLIRVPAVTARLETDFKAPVPVGRVVHIDAQIVGVAGRKVYTHAIGRLDGPDGQVVLTSGGLFIQVPLGHFQEHGRPEDVERIVKEREAAGMVPGGLIEVNP